MFIGYQLVVAWQHDYPAPVAVKQSISINQQLPSSSEVATTAQQQSWQQTSNGGYIPSNIDVEHEAPKSSSPYSNDMSNAVAKANQSFLYMKSDVLELKINATTGNVVGANLLQYDQSSSERNVPFKLMMDDVQKYVANSSLFIKSQKGVQNLNVHYTSEQKNYQLKPGQNTLQVILKGETDSGIKVSKIFTLNRGDYLIQLNYDIQNQSTKPWTGQMNTQFLQQNPKEEKSSMFHVGTYSGAAMSDPSDKLYQKVSFADIADKNLNKKVDGGWIAMQQHYFLTAWVPQTGTTNYFDTRCVNYQYIIGMVSNAFTVPVGGSKSIGAKFYAGPEITSRLETLAPGLNLTIDFGILSVISLFLFTVMSYIHSFVGNWGWSIVLVTVLIKLVFYRLSAKSYKSMAAMRRLQPKIMALREKYSEDKAKLSQETMALYQSEKVNPLGGCLPIVVQIPVFIALYWVLLESVELRQAPWILWIKDLSDPDPYMILPIIMGASMLIQQNLGPASPDPTQAKMMMFLPLIFTVLFLSFPAGLVLYWTVNNSLSILQQWYITRKYGDQKPADGKKKDRKKDDNSSNKKFALQR